MRSRSRRPPITRARCRRCPWQRWRRPTRPTPGDPAPTELGRVRGCASRRGVLDVGRDQVGRLTRLAGITGVVRGRYITGTTVREVAAPGPGQARLGRPERPGPAVGGRLLPRVDRDRVRVHRDSRQRVLAPDPGLAGSHHPTHAGGEIRPASGADGPPRPRIRLGSNRTDSSLGRKKSAPDRHRQRRPSSWRRQPTSAASELLEAVVHDALTIAPSSCANQGEAAGERSVSPIHSAARTASASKTSARRSGVTVPSS